MARVLSGAHTYGMYVCMYVCMCLCVYVCTNVCTVMFIFEYIHGSKCKAMPYIFKKTNTRITDPEILERRYPVILRQFSIRRGSGGKGRYHGGDGVVRELEFTRVRLLCRILPLKGSSICMYVCMYVCMSSH